MGTAASAESAKGTASHFGPYFWDLLYILLGVSLFVAAVILVILIIRAVTTRQILIEPFTVAKVGEELGWSGIALAHRLVDELIAIQRRSRSSKEGEVFLRPGELRDYVTVSAAGIGFTYQSLVTALRDALQ